MDLNQAQNSDSLSGMKNLGKMLAVAAGWCCIVLGVVGIFLPLLPTTPFLLLAAWIFAKSSPRFHSWLLNHPRLGPIILAWQSGDGIPRKVRNRALFMLWLCLSISMLIIGKLWAVLMLTTIGCCSSFYILKQPVNDALPEVKADS